jgi:hypothetical protein
MKARIYVAHDKCSDPYTRAWSDYIHSFYCASPLQSNYCIPSRRKRKWAIKTTALNYGVAVATRQYNKVVCFLKHATMITAPINILIRYTYWMSSLYAYARREASFQHFNVISNMRLDTWWIDMKNISITKYTHNIWEAASRVITVLHKQRREVETFAFMTWALVGDEWSASGSGQVTPEEKASGTHCIGWWMGPRACVDVMKRKCFTLLRLELRILSRPDRS